jgi:16S rRNA C967 or C1407 C5-methylase (RsmB/RsmF family)
MISHPGSQLDGAGPDIKPHAGERVLDLCAAPGNKTARMAQALGNRGTVVANDIFWQRIRPLQSAIDRLWLLNVSVTCHDGTAYRGQPVNLIASWRMWPAAVKAPAAAFRAS